MNILYYWAEDESFMSQWQRMHIFDDLEHSGHKIKVFNHLDYESLDQANEELISYVKSNKINVDLFMSCVSSDLLYKESILTIKKNGIPTLLICFDNLHAPYMHKKTSPFFDLVWLTSIETKYLFDKWGANTIFLPYAANPFAFYPKPKDEIPAIGFIGTPYGTRINKLNMLTDNKVRCNLYTSSLKTTKDPSHDTIINSALLHSFFNLSRFPIGRKVILGAALKKIMVNEDELHKNEYLKILPSVSFSEMNELYSNLSLSLGITELRNTFTLRKPIHKLHLRTFEIPMCGGLQISTYTDELASYFEDDKEILLYRNNDELISKAHFYLRPDNDNLRMQIKTAARLRAKNDHSWSIRFQKVFDYFGLNGNTAIKK